MMIVDAAWLAGIVEGEGCIDAPRGLPRVRVKMTDRDVVTRAAALMGASVYSDDWGARVHGYRPSFVAQLTGPRAVSLLEQIAPMMGERRARKIAKVVGEYAPHDKKASPR